MEPEDDLHEGVGRERVQQQREAQHEQAARVLVREVAVEPHVDARERDQQEAVQRREKHFRHDGDGFDPENGSAPPNGSPPDDADSNSSQ